MTSIISKMRQAARWSLVPALLLFVAACETKAPVLKSIVLAPTVLTLSVGESADIEAFGGMTDGFINNITEDLVWSSSDPTIAELSNGSTLKALKAGQVTITAKDTATKVEASLNVNITEATLAEISISPSAPNLAKGRSQQLTATATYSNGLLSDVTSRVTWSITDSNVATVSATGTLVTVSPGTTAVKATLNGVTATEEFRVTNAELTHIDVSAQVTSLPIGTTTRLKATGIYSDNSVADLTTSVVWSVSDAMIGGISNAEFAQGVFAASAAGPVTVKATDLITGQNGTTVLAVTTAALQRIDITYANSVLSLNSGETALLHAVGHYSDNSTSDLTRLGTWTSSNSAVMGVAADGTATAVGEGDANLSFTYQGTSVARWGHVSAAVLRQITITGPTTALGFGDAAPLKAIGTYSDGSTADLTSRVTWASANNRFVYVSNDDGTRGLMWMLKAQAPVAITATMGAFTATYTATTTNPTGGLSASWWGGIETSPIAKASYNRARGLMAFGPSGYRDMSPLCTYTTSQQSAGVTARVANNPVERNFIYIDGPTGGTFWLWVSFPDGTGMGSGITLP